MMNDRPISDGALGIVREMCDTTHSEIQLPVLIVKGMIARIDQREAQSETFDGAMAAAEWHMSKASEALDLATLYAQSECPDALRMLNTVSNGLHEMSQTVIEIRAFR